MKFYFKFIFMSCFLINLAKAENPTENIDKKIHKLEEKKQIEEFQSGNEELEGQRFMIGDWDRYSKEIEEVKEHQKKIREIDQEIDSLQKQKAEIKAHEHQ